MATLSLFELKDALTALGVSTATGDLRGKARRDELARRLQHHEWASGEVGLKEGRGEEGVQGLENLSLAELRSALELQQISTQTPGLKGDARRHALIQRLMNAYSNKQKAQDEISSRIGSSDEEEDDSRSETSSSAYSNATEFIFYDLLKERLEADPVLEMKATSPTPQLSLTWPKRAKESDVMALSSTHQLQRELFELRTQLHSARQEQQQRVEKALQEAGISTSLDEISTKLQALERERRRLQENYFGHELVTSDVLSSTGSNQVPLELVQEDALCLIVKRQDVLKQMAERTKEAMAVAKSHSLGFETAPSKLLREKEAALLKQIQHLESRLGSASVSASTVSTQSCWPSSISSEYTRLAPETPVLARCRSTPNGLRPDLWEKMDSHERQQLHSELRTATSFHLRRDRVVLNTTAHVGKAPLVPSQADKLGMKARFMAKTQLNQHEINRVYLNALELDENHAENLGNYALFLCTICGEPEKASNYFQRALAADPMNAKNLANYANFLVREYHDLTKSEVCYKKALELAPKDANVLGGYADLLTAKTHRNGEHLLLARRILTKAVAISPSHQLNRLRLALVLADLNENEKAEHCFEQLLPNGRQNQALQSGNPTHAEMPIQRDNLLLAYIYEKYATFLHRRGDWPRSKTMYGEALALAPERPSLIRHFSCFLRESKPYLSSRSQFFATS